MSFLFKFKNGHAKYVSHSIYKNPTHIPNKVVIEGNLTLFVYYYYTVVFLSFNKCLCV